MSTIRKVEINSKIQCESYEYVWKLHDFGTVQESDIQLALQKFEMQIGRARNVQSKWLVGLKPDNKTVQFYFRLLQKTGDQSKISTRVSVSYGKSEDSLTFLKTVENATALNEEFEIGTHWKQGNPAATWNTSTDKNGIFFVQLKVDLLALQAEKSQNPELSLQEVKKASLNRLLGNFSKLLEDSASHDIKIVCNDGTEIGAHKIILSAQNPVFASMFDSDLSENRTGVIKVADISGKTMKLLLHYLYTGDLLPEWRQPDTIVEFTYAAGKYQLTEVLEMLDGVLGSEDDSYCNLVLLNLVNKLSLENAEAKLMERIVRLTNAAKGSKDIVAIFGKDC